MNTYLNIKANKKQVGIKISTKENILPVKKFSNKFKELFLNNKKSKQINNEKENNSQNILTEIGNGHLKLDTNIIKAEKPIKSKICKLKLKKEKPKDIKKVKFTKNSYNNNNNNNNVIKLQKKIIPSNQNKKKYITSIPLFKKYVEKTLTSNNTYKNIKNKNKVLINQRTYSISEVNKTDINTKLDHYNRNSNLLNANYYTENNFNIRDKTNSADVSPHKIKQLKKIIKNNKNKIIEEKINGNYNNNSMIVGHRKRRGVIKLSVLNDFNYIDKKIKKLNFNSSKDVKDVNLSVNKIKVNNNPQIVEEYLEDIYKYLKLIENGDLPIKNYMKITQKYISEKMRAILVDWLIDIHSKFRLLDETLFLTINIIDRYLSKKSINKKYFQLLGITAMFISSKYEDIYPPEIKDFIYMTDNAYSREELLYLESDILDKIGFNLTYPTSLRFLEIFRKLLNLKDKDFYQCRYFIEICLFDYNCCSFSPSLIAATSIMLNYKINKYKNKGLNDLEDEILKNIIGYNIEEIKPCLICLMDALKQINDLNNRFTSLKRKFVKEEFMKVSSEKIDINNILEFIKTHK